MMQFLDAACAESVPAVNQDTRDAFSHIVLLSAELADVKPSGLVVEVQDSRRRCGRIHFHNY
jgi:hypothetical protein